MIFRLTVTPGANVVKRKSDESSVTIPFEQTFRDLETAAPAVPLAPGGNIILTSLNYTNHEFDVMTV